METDNIVPGFAINEHVLNRNFEFITFVVMSVECSCSVHRRNVNHRRMNDKLDARNSESSILIVLFAKELRSCNANPSIKST